MNNSLSEIERIFRAESGRVIAALLTHIHDMELVEDALQDATVQAMEQWPAHETPKNPGGWLLHVARCRLIDRLRQVSHRTSDTTQQAVIDTLYQEIQYEDDQLEELQDERLRLIFTCCHPALSREAQVALTLKSLCGLNSREIARAYLTSEVTMNQRLTRAKRKIRDAGIRYEIPTGKDLIARLPPVLAVIYLIYNESYSAFEGQSLTREDLANEAIYLAQMLYKLLPEPEAAGLLALLLLHDARRPARTNQSGTYIPLEQQDRTLWNQSYIRKGKNLLITAMSPGKIGNYQIQAAISALHSESPSWQETDWPQILLLYDRLLKSNDSDIVRLNRCMALAYSGDLLSAYDQISTLESKLNRYQPLYAAKAELASKLKFCTEAKASYQKAIKLTDNLAEKNYLEQKLKNIEQEITA